MNLQQWALVVWSVVMPMFFLSVIIWVIHQDRQDRQDRREDRRDQEALKRRRERNFEQHRRML